MRFALAILLLAASVHAAPRRFADVVEPARAPRVHAPLSIVFMNGEQRWLASLRPSLARELGASAMDRIRMRVALDLTEPPSYVVQHGCVRTVIERAHACTPVDEFSGEVVIDLRCHATSPKAIAETIKKRIASS